MQTSLRKMGNSTGMIVPRAVLAEVGVSSGAIMDISVIEGKIVAVPVPAVTRSGWAEAAAAIGADETASDEAEWRGFGNEDDATYTW